MCRRLVGTVSQVRSTWHGTSPFKNDGSFK